ncbi:MAG: BlaR1 family beta-lactam sensor/signal transducer [Lachnospiraceae bacterium]|nr:BlaR1 family beta-lactam sensor/signal transducer [Lachnospiraceae bacterium]
MVGFAVYFFICNIFISGIICVLFLAKKAFRTKLSSRMQYHLGFALFVLLALPFIPFRIPDIFSWLNTLIATHSDHVNPVTNGISRPYLTNASKQAGDFAVSVSHRAPSLISHILCCLWFAGICMMIFLMAKSLFRLRGIIKSSLPLQNSEVRNLYYECLSETGINLEIPIYSTAFLKSPVIFGFLKPRIYLPIHTISDYNATGMRFMLLHELQHFKHKDMIINYLINISGILYWFNPFVWYALKEMRCEREIACDSSVLQMLRETEYENYGNTLINFAEKISRDGSSFSPFPFVTGIGGNMKQIKKRILNISNYRKENHRQKIQSRLAYILIIAIFLVLLPVLPTYASRQERYDFHEENKDITYVDLSSDFNKCKGCFVLYDANNDAWTIYNKDAALEQITPNSTYKIYDALLGLESGIITPEYSKMTWNGKEYPFDAWESDQDLSSAMQSSVNWYFQNIDNIAGMDNVKSYLQDIGYGNQQTSNDTDLYWTDFSLKISPIEQVELLKKFYHNTFGFFDSNINAVKDAILIASTPDGTLSGKTGTGRVDGQDTNGWFIGYIEKSARLYYFATNIQGSSNATGSKATEISLSILSDMGLWKSRQNR